MAADPDKFDDRLDDVENELAALRGLERQVIGLGERLGRLDTRLINLGTRIDKRFDEPAIGPIRAGTDWRTVLAVVSGITIPIVAVLIATGRTP